MVATLCDAAGAALCSQKVRLQGKVGGAREEEEEAS